MLALRVLFKSFYWKVIQFLFSFFITVSLAHILMPSVSASFYSLIYLFSLVAAFFSLGLDVGLNYFITRKELTPQNSLIVILIVTLLAVFVSLPCIYLFYTPASPVIFNKNEILLLAALQITGSLLTVLSSAVLTAFQKNYVATKLLVLFNGLTLILLIVISRCVDMKHVVSAIFYTIYAATFIQGIVFYLLIYSKYSRGTFLILWQSSSVIKIIKYSFLAFIINFIFLTGGRVQILILPYLVSANEAGNYIQAYKVQEYMNTIVAFVYFPLVAISAAKKEGVQNMILFLIRAVNTFTVAFALVFVLFGKIIFPFTFGMSFTSMYEVFLYLIPALVTSCSSSFFTAYFFGKGYLKYNLLSASVLLLTVICLSFPFIHLYSINGAAVAQSTACVLSLFTDIYLFKKTFRCKITDMLFIKRRDYLFIYSLFSTKKSVVGDC